ncbi:MAG: hypothetical protein ACTSVI_17075 [Promethearchaeota archaeon]
MLRKAWHDGLISIIKEHACSCLFSFNIEFRPLLLFNTLKKQVFSIIITCSSRF